jgi:sugar (pentulose or hexulose) kinase
MASGFLGIDAGTQGLSVVFTDEELNLVATGEGPYDMLPGLDEGCYEQSTADWESALIVAMKSLREKLDEDPEVLCVGISGQMHGEVLADAEGNSRGPVRLWCDSRNESEGDELTKLFGVKMPKRITAARWLWTLRNQTEKANSVAHITTPAGWLAYRLTGQWTLGIGDAAGMFPIDQSTLDYDSKLLTQFDDLTPDGTPTLVELLPRVLKAGEDAGQLDENGANLLGLPVGTPVAPAEGDQPASLAGSLIGSAGTVSVSFGTSVCANSVGDRAFEGVSDCVDHFCAPDGKPINMVWLRNGTTFMNSVVEMFGAATGGDRNSGFAQVMPQMLAAASDCGGLLALPFMDDEPGLGVGRGGTAMLVGLNPENATPGNAVKAALLSTMFNLKLGSEQLDQRGYPRSEIVLAGGITKTPETGQILADVFGTNVTLLDSAEEGTAWGAAVMAKFRRLVMQGQADDWATFLKGLSSAATTQFNPAAEQVKAYQTMYEQYKSLLSAHEALDQSLNG